MVIFTVLRFALGLVFAAAGVAACFGYQPIVRELKAVGLGNGYVYLAAFANILGGVMVVAPQTAVYGAIILLVMAVQAVLIHLVVLKQAIIGPTIVMLLVVLVLLQILRVIF